jgi:release factor glutamine methyltransferase
MAGTPSAALATELLLMHVLVRDRAWLYAHPEESLKAPQSAHFNDLLSARAAGVPTQYLNGKQEFWGLELEVTPDVLIPRPETEHVVEVALERIGAARKNARLDAIDVGTGSGCIAIALAKELPEATIYAADISAGAIAVATRNAARHNVAGRVRFAVSNLLLDIKEPAEFDLVTSNPPYISRSDAPALPPDVRDHEPGIALFAGADGLDFYRPLIAQAGRSWISTRVPACPTGVASGWMSGWAAWFMVPPVDPFSENCYLIDITFPGRMQVAPSCALWIPPASPAAGRLGDRRVQRCFVGDHSATVTRATPPCRAGRS